MTKPTTPRRFNAQEPIWPPGFVPQLPGLMRDVVTGAKKSVGASAANQRAIEAEGVEQRLSAIRSPARGKELAIKPRKEPV